MSTPNPRLQFEEQLQSLRIRLGNQVPTERWTDLWHAQHDRAFMVAGAAKADLLADLAGAVEGAIAGGQSIEWFRQQFDEIVAKHGWAHTGERNWRTRVIYQTNMSTSYAAGRLAQLRDPELRRLKPYWMYNHNDSVLHPRPLHVAWDGLTLPADHPWFRTHYPPNGWGCQCYITAVSAAEARRRGGRITDTPRDDGTDPETGRPNGIDRGWDYMPGDTMTGDLQRQIGAKLPKLPSQLRPGLDRDINKIPPPPAIPPDPIPPALPVPRPSPLPPPSPALPPPASPIPPAAPVRPSAPVPPSLTRVHEDGVRYVLENGLREAAGRIEYVSVYNVEGAIILQKRGRESAVEFSDDEIARMRANPGAVLIHNHPSSSSLSRADFSLQSKVLGGGEVWAIGHDGTQYRGRVLRAPAFAAVYPLVEEAIRKDLQARIYAGAIPIDEANLWHSHVINSVLAMLGVVAYERIGGDAPAWVYDVINRIRGALP